MRRLLRVSERLELLACYTLEGVSSIREGLGRTLLIYYTLEKTLTLLFGISMR